MFPIDQNSLADIAVQNQVLPAGGPKIVPINLSFASNAGWSLDGQNMQSLGRFSNLQTLYVDNSNNAQLLTITVGGGGQVIKVKAGVQGYYAVLAANPIKITFSVPATGATDKTAIFLLNFPLAPFSWATT